jgi:flagellar biosynthesis protein FliR
LSPTLEQVLVRALLIGLRVGGLMTFAPFFGSISVPARIKAGFTLVLTGLLYTVCPVPAMALTAGNWLRVVLSEAAVGLMMGLAVQLVLEGMQIAGQLAGVQLGFSLASIIDPLTNIDTPVFATFFQMIALLIFLQLNVHHWILRALVKSFDYLPVGTAEITPAAVRELLRAAGGMWLLGVQIAAPVLLATMLLDITIGFLTRASPQLPALFIGISAKNLIGYVVVAASAALWPSLLEKQFTNALGWTEQLLRLAH